MTENLPHRQFEEALNQPPQEFRPLIENYAELDIKLAAYIQSGNVDVPPANRSDVPHNDAERRKAVHHLFLAYHDCSQCVEPVDFLSVYSEGEVHLALWQLLRAIEDAASGICTIPRYASKYPYSYQSFPSFEARLTNVTDTLKISKNTCKNMFTNELFSARLAWNPHKEAGRKIANKKLNAKRAETLRLGSEVKRVREFGQEQANDNDEVETTGLNVNHHQKNPRENIRQTQKLRTYPAGKQTSTAQAVPFPTSRGLPLTQTAPGPGGGG
ncbi:hypothetical protein F5Y15DRAFT_415210 [Xylariaceae sp. FL0016]|nr:hypothetical protein F5Y15DRAFT_415210 [Xylariaceae sp. FL0016]